MATETFSDFILRRATKDVTNHQIWIPIAHLQVEEDFQFGDVKIIAIPKSLFDAREQKALREHPDDAARSSRTSSSSSENLYREMRP